MEVNKIISNINSQLLSIFGKEDLKELKSSINSTGAVISGSFIIQCILNEKWCNSDIDIFVPMTFISICSDEPSLDINTFFEKKYKKINCQYTKEYSYLCIDNHFKYINCYTVNDTKIQIINTSFDNQDLVKFIMNSFDFNICKNMYKITKNKEELFIFDIKNIKDRKLKWNYISNIQSSILRGYKYQSRGFDVIYDIKSLESIQEYIHRYMVQCNRIVNQFI